MGRKVFVVGVGMTKFEKPGAARAGTTREMAKEAGTKALADAGIPYNEIEQACVGYVLRRLDVRASARSTGSGSPASRSTTSTTTAPPARPRCSWRKQFIEGGIADCVLALGFEKMDKGSLGVEVHRTARTRWTGT